ncbi:hypothetical protein EJ997_10150 [Flaviflexus ciconiae]|uniref:Uncharacterized protein n=1 Tax=Flaviflexus ciconiae TaxID=2496867 RepID=A0A3S9PZ73_9ACTO|nr:hypothetical protein [Flaviflexus ciconiae]AZQ77644.1 hypothetical protein EJ997_10150 [Flaviflexus ciconiae]
MIRIADILTEYADAFATGDRDPHLSNISTDLMVIAAAIHGGKGRPLVTDHGARRLRREILICIHGRGHWATECTPACREGSTA